MGRKRGEREKGGVTVMNGIPSNFERRCSRWEKEREESKRLRERM